MVQLNTIKINPRNPRIVKSKEFKQLVQSLRDFPEMLAKRPIVVDNWTDRIVLAGNQRLAALREIGLDEVPDEYFASAEGWTDEQKDEFLVKDNIHAGDFEWNVLQTEWDLNTLNGWGVNIPDKHLVEPEAKDDEFKIPKNVETDIVEGDMFEIGPHKLICGDSTKPETWYKLLGNEQVDCVVTDPPYNVAYVGKTKDALTIQNDAMKDNDFFTFLCNFYTSLAAFTKPGGAWYVWHADSEGANFRRAMTKSGIMVKQCLIWVKNSMVMGRQDYQWKHEPCLYGWKEGASHSWYGDRKQTTILEFDRPTRSTEHPTMKPVPLIAYQIKNSSRQGDIIADGFGGSGTTMVAAHQMMRKARLAELGPVYCQVILDRMRKLEPGILVKKNGKEI